MRKKSAIGMLIALILAGLSTSHAQSIDYAPSTRRPDPATVTVYRDLVRFVVSDANQLRIEIFNPNQEKIFDSGWATGAALDWFIHDQQALPVESALYSYELSINGDPTPAQRGNVIVDREREGLMEAPPLSLSGGKHKKGVFHPFTDGVFDVNATGGSYNINTARMGIGTSVPLIRLHVGAGAAPPVTAGATLLLEEGLATSMVMKSSSGGEMFFYQDQNNGLFGTASTHPVGIRTDNTNRVWIEAGGNVGIGTTLPTKKLVVGGGNGNSGIFNDGIFVNIPGGAAITARDSTTGAEVEVNAESPGIGTVGTFSNHPLNFRTNNIERVRIDTSGKVSIGATSSPGAKLYVENNALAVHGKNTGSSGSGAFFEITSLTNGSDALFVETQGTGAALSAFTSGSGDALVATAAGGFAGNFNGPVSVSGTLFADGGLQTSGTKNFKIDHPLDPANKYLVHASIESSEVKNLYDGVIVLDRKGTAVVNLPDWFEVLNRDFRYQLTCIGGYAQVYVAEEIANHHFKIAGGKPGMKISWQVTGNRQDPIVSAHPMQVEEAKPEGQRGYYLHPELYGQPEDKGLEWARRPEQMRQMKEQREKAQSGRIQQPNH